ncbi:MAG: hypothetical protein ABFC71_06375 [Methanoregula sp.]
MNSYSSQNHKKRGDFYPSPVTGSLLFPGSAGMIANHKGKA